MTDSTTTTDVTDADLGEVTIVRVHDGPIDLVFDCMTQPEHLTHFWGPTGTSTPLEGITVDLRPGGVFETVMRSDDDGSEFTMRAVYVEIIRPTRLVWTEPDVEGGMTTTVDFVALDDGRTQVTTVQTNVPAMYRTSEAQAGLESAFDCFDAYLAELRDRS